MMAFYSVTLDLSSRSLHVIVHSAFDLATARTYVADLAQAAEQLRRQSGPSRWLIDLTRCLVQPKEVAAYFAGSLPRIIPADATIAVVTKAALTAIQSKRVAPDANHATFQTIEAARAWLVGKQAA